MICYFSVEVVIWGTFGLTEMSRVSLEKFGASSFLDTAQWDHWDEICPYRKENLTYLDTKHHKKVNIFFLLNLHFQKTQLCLCFHWTPHGYFNLG